LSYFGWRNFDAVINDRVARIARRLDIASQHCGNIFSAMRKFSSPAKLLRYDRMTFGNASAASGPLKKSGDAHGNDPDHQW
jgi:hypothetical protein